MQYANSNPLKRNSYRVRSLSRWLQSAGLGIFSAMAACFSAHAAETLYFDFGPFGRSISIASLERFVEEGVVDPELAPFLRRFSTETQEDLRKALNNPQQIDVAVLSQWLYEPMGERLLASTGEVIQTASGQNGQKSIRAAVIQAAAEPGGLTAINTLKYFPTPGIRLDLALALKRWRTLQAAAEETLAIVDEISQASTDAAAADPAVDYATLPNLTQSGPFSVVSQTITLNDTTRNRIYPADIYQPENLNAVTGPIPVLLLSHGYGDTRSRFSDVATHLASHGMVVALPEHIGSNTDQKEAMKAWLSRESFKPGDFVDRPLDISFLLDELERRNQSDFQGRLLLDRVAMSGHSFGGYTSLAVGGATVDLERLEQRCSASNIPAGVNLAYLLACRALELPLEARQLLTDGSLRDDRVQLVIVFAPVSNLFGESGVGNIQTPTVIMGGAYDIAAPAVPEQVTTFSWLTSFDRYLYLAEKTSHGAQLTRWLAQLFNPSERIEENFEEAQQWFRGIVSSLLVAYPKVYLLGQEQFRPYLTSNYVETVSKEPFILNMVRSLP